MKRPIPASPARRSRAFLAGASAFGLMLMSGCDSAYDLLPNVFKENRPEQMTPGARRIPALNPGGRQTSGTEALSRVYPRTAPAVAEEKDWFDWLRQPETETAPLFETAPPAGLAKEAEQMRPRRKPLPGNAAAPAQLPPVASNAPENTAPAAPEPRLTRRLAAPVVIEPAPKDTDMPEIAASPAAPVIEPVSELAPAAGKAPSGFWEPLPWGAETPNRSPEPAPPEEKTSAPPPPKPDAPAAPEAAEAAEAATPVPLSPIMRYWLTRPAVDSSAQTAQPPAGAAPIELAMTSMPPRNETLPETPPPSLESVPPPPEKLKEVRQEHPQRLQTLEKAHREQLEEKKQLDENPEPGSLLKEYREERREEHPEKSPSRPPAGEDATSGAAETPPETQAAASTPIYLPEKHREEGGRPPSAPPLAEAPPPPAMPSIGGGPSAMLASGAIAPYTKAETAMLPESPYRERRRQTPVQPVH